MKLLTETIREALLIRQSAEENGNSDIHFVPVVKLFTPDAACTWLLTELDPEEPDIAFGLCDLGMGYPELGSVRVSELEAVRGRLGLLVERDLHFAPLHTIAVYARAAWNAEAIIESKQALQDAARQLTEDRDGAP